MINGYNKINLVHTGWDIDATLFANRFMSFTNGITITAENAYYHDPAKGTLGNTYIIPVWIYKIGI